MSMSMIDRPRLLLRYCQISCNYTKNQQMMFGTNMHPQCVKTGDLNLYIRQYQRRPHPNAGQRRSLYRNMLT